MNISELNRRKRELGLTNRQIAALSGIPLSTIQKVLSGTTSAPRRNTLEAIELALAAEEVRRRELTGLREPADMRDSIPYIEYVAQNLGPNEVREPSVTYGSSSRKDVHTIEDYYALPDGVRVELIDGVFYDMGAPSVIHQKILGELHLLFRECAEAHGGDCEVFLSPCDVRLDRDDYTMIQPDLLVICGEFDLDGKRIEGAPDLTLEILSPSTRAKDMLLKLHKYQRAGVKEYWIVDPKNAVVLVYDLQNEDFFPERYGFDATIPVHLTGGACAIDFSRVQKALDRSRSRHAAADQ